MIKRSYTCAKFKDLWVEKACDQSNGWGEEMSSYKEILDLRITCADERLFPPVDYVTVGADKGMTVVFRDGTEVSV